MKDDKTARPILIGGAVWSLVYLLATTLLPSPPRALQVLCADTFLFVPSAIAAVLAGRAARDSTLWERGFWSLLACSSGAYAASHVLFAVHETLVPASSTVRLVAHLGYTTYILLAGVSLLVRPDRPRGPQELRAAVLEWLMAIVGGYFLVVYFALLPRSETSSPWFLILFLQEALPAVGAIALALKVRAEPFRGVYTAMAVGFGAGVVVSLPPNWLYAQGAYSVYNPWDVAWILPSMGIAVAARMPRGRGWVELHREEGVWRPPKFAAAAVAIPPLIDLLTRTTGRLGHLVDVRSHLTLSCTLVMVVLAALRVHRGALVPSAGPVSELREAEGPAAGFLQFASGVAHELNNPLMAVAGHAELALKKGAHEEPVGQLAEAARRAAEVVARLQRITESSQETGP